MNQPRCLSCNTSMQEGFLLDQFGDYRKDNLFWVSGTFSSFMMGHENVLPVVSCRCPSCGLLSNYAFDQTQTAQRSSRRQNEEHRRRRDEFPDREPVSTATTVA